MPLQTISNISNYVTNNNVTWTQPPKRVTITDFTNPLFPRQIVVSPNGIQVTRPDNGVGIAIPDLMAVVLAVNPAMTWPPLFTTQPSDQSVQYGGGRSATFTIAVNSELSVTYQWQSSADNATWGNVSNGGVYAGATSASLVITPTDFTQNGLYYRCQVTNSRGTTTSVSAKLTVTGLPVFTVQPTNQSAIAPAPATFSATVVANPAPVTYQWQVSTNGGVAWSDIAAGAPYTGQTTNSLTLNPTAVGPPYNGYQYRLKATNSLGTTTSSAATLTVT